MCIKHGVVVAQAQQFGLCLSPMYIYAPLLNPMIDVMLTFVMLAMCCSLPYVGVSLLCVSSIWIPKVVTEFCLINAHKKTMLFHTFLCGLNACCVTVVLQERKGA